MSSKSDIATAHFHSGLNCAQSVVAAFCEKYDMDRSTMIKMCSGLGAGFRSGEICGAVSGAILVIGLKYGQNIADDKSSRDNCNAKTIEFMNLFRTKNKSVRCKDILGLDLSIKEAYEQAQKQNLFKTTCVDMVVSAVELLEALGY